MTDDSPVYAPLDRMTLVRDVALLQVKLVVDGLRDFLLVPISLVAGMIGFIRFGENGGRDFYKLLRIGRRSERWINLFGAADRTPTEETERDHFPDADIDAMVARVEAFVVDEEKRGAVSDQARERLRKVVDTLSQRRNPGSDGN